MLERPTLYLFSTGRALEGFYRAQDEGFLPYAMTFEGFLSTIRLFPQKKRLPSSLRPLFLSIAASKVEVERLGFESNFLSFLENSPFFLSFFDELASVGVSLPSLASFDVYDEYGDHLGVLERLLEAYKSELEGFGYIDEALFEAEFYEEFVRGYGEIRFLVEGFLSLKEMELLNQVASITPLVVTLEIDGYNLDYYRRLGMTKEELERNYRYEIEWGSQMILSKKALPPLGSVNAYAFGSRLDQVALVLERIHTWVNEGIEPERIAIILPDERFADYLRLFDKERNFNYAMGERFSDSSLFLSLQKEIERLESLPPPASLLELSPLGLEALRAFTLELESQGEIEASRLLQEGITLLAPLERILENRPPSEILRLLLKEFATRRIDDVGGGRIRVMGILETRGLNFDRVVVVDFNEGLIPKPSDKDLFLNSSIRAKCHLPTRLERENLQKHYYLSLLRRAKESVLAFVSNEQNEPSRMLLELQTPIFSGKELYERTLFGAPREHKGFVEEIIDSIPWERERFSHSRLQSFLLCKRQYYYRYIRGYSQREEENESAWLGKTVHRWLKESFDPSISQKKRREHFLSLLQKERFPSAKLAFEARATAKKMERFFEREKERAKEGAQPLWLEERVEFEVEGIDFVGFIDRVDQVGEEYWILDYKLKKALKVDKERDLEKTSDFQFALYAQALRQRVGGAVAIRAFYYDLFKGTLEEEEHLEEKIALLPLRLARLKEKNLSFELCEDARVCRYCAYTAICDRED